MYHRAVLPSRERLLQIARLAGLEAFTGRLGPPASAEPDAGDLRSFVDERLESIAAALVEEAAASDDVIDRKSAEAYLEDRLRTLADLLTPEQAEALRTSFQERTAGW